jgi:hypothetical protein
MPEAGRVGRWETGPGPGGRVEEDGQGKPLRQSRRFIHGPVADKFRPGYQNRPLGGQEEVGRLPDGLRVGGLSPGQVLAPKVRDFGRPFGGQNLRPKGDLNRAGRGQNYRPGRNPDRLDQVGRSGRLEPGLYRQDRPGPVGQDDGREPRSQRKLTVKAGRRRMPEVYNHRPTGGPTQAVSNRKNSKRVRGGQVDNFGVTEAGFEKLSESFSGQAGQVS